MNGDAPHGYTGQALLGLLNEASREFSGLATPGQIARAALLAAMGGPEPVTVGALAVALERLFAELATGREAVEMHLAHGASAREASQEAVRRAVRAGMAPSVTALMGVGLVFLPGMMTGQILAGADPTSAIRYQIVVMLMLVGATTLASVMAVLWVRERCFTPRQQLKL